MDCLFEWSMHEPVALKEGVDPKIIAVIKDRSSTAELPDKPAAIIELARECFGNHKVSPATYARAAAHFTPHALVDLVLLMGSAGQHRGHPAGVRHAVAARRRAGFRGMIVRQDEDGSLVLITQNDHAQASATFAAHWGNQRFAPLRSAGCDDPGSDAA